MARSLHTWVFALGGIAAIAWVTSAFLPVLGLASSALLFLLPVLYAAVRGGVAPGLVTALTAAAAYNFFLLPPRFTFRIHGVDNTVSALVLVVVALVTSRLATRLKSREAEALERARASDEAAELSAILSGHPPSASLDAGLDWMGSRYGDIRLLDPDAAQADKGMFSSLDLSAGAWALHNGDVTGHATEVMGAADWTFLPLSPKSRRGDSVAALARPADGAVRTSADLQHISQLCLLLGQCRDRGALEAERRERERLEQADSLRRTFLASLAHDFRTPLTIISGRLALLANDSDDAREALFAARRLDRMMTDLVSAARIEAGTLAPAMESVDLIDALDAASEGAGVAADICLSREIAPDLPFVAGDPVLLHHIIANLIDNAVRHARSHVTLRAAVADGCVRLSVIDDGPGVPVAERARIFERFVRLEGSDRTSGSGLGLAIVKGFADAMGMTISVDAAAGGGSSFTLAMPLAANPTP